MDGVLKKKIILIIGSYSKKRGRGEVIGEGEKGRSREVDEGYGREG